MTTRNAFASRVVAASIGLMAATTAQASPQSPIPDMDGIAAERWADPVAPLSRYRIEAPAAMVTARTFEESDPSSLQSRLETLDDLASRLEDSVDRLGFASMEVLQAGGGGGADRSPSARIEAAKAAIDAARNDGSLRKTAGIREPSLDFIVDPTWPADARSDVDALRAYVVEQEDLMIALNQAVMAIYRTDPSLVGEEEALDLFAALKEALEGWEPPVSPEVARTEAPQVKF